MEQNDEETDNAQASLYVDRDHSWPACVFISSGLSMCITVDILQYSMPLAFLPSVLEDRGHSPMKIATAIGIYYWTGFLGGLLLTSFQVWRLLYRRQKNNTEVTDLATAKKHIWFLIIGLGVGTVTLFVQALHPRWAVHTTCRFIQGFAGAFIFFYTFLLSVALFKNEQQNMAMTFASCALNVAEVFGSFVGAVLFDSWGQRSVFWFLGIASMVNQALLFAILLNLRGTESMLTSNRTTSGSLGAPPCRNVSLSSVDSRLDGGDAAGGPARASSVCGCLPPMIPGAMTKFKHTMNSRPLICANLLITMAAVVKGSVEEMLPFHADHRWGMAPMEIGKLFCTIAIAYIIAASLAGKFWTSLGRFQVCFSAYWLFMLGLVAWMVFAVVTYFPDAATLTIMLSFYGICLGMTHTPAALLIASVVDHEEGVGKDAVNGIWNTMWEAGGSVGFLLGGLLAERYHEQMALLTWCALGCAATAVVMTGLSTYENDAGCFPFKPQDAKPTVTTAEVPNVDYGTMGVADTA